MDSYLDSGAWGGHLAPMNKVLSSVTSTLAQVGFAWARQSMAAAAESTRRSAAQDLEDVYHGIEATTKALWKAELLKVTNSINPEKAPYRQLRILHRMVDQLAMSYKDPAKRTVGASAEDPANDKYQELLAKSNIGQAMRQAEAMARLHNTVLIRPVWDNEAERLDYRVYTPAHTDVEPMDDDWRRPESVLVYVVTPGTWGKRTVVHAWRKEEAVRIDHRGDGPLSGADDTANPYGDLPFAVLRLEETGEFWGPGARDLLDGQIGYQVLESALGKNAISQGFSRWLGVNLKLNRSAITAGSALQDSATVEWGPDKIHCRDEVQTGEVLPDLKAVTPTPAVDALTNVLNNLLRSLCWTRGLSTSRALALVSGAVTGESGVSKAMDDADLEELRQAAQESLREAERDLYRVTRMVLATDAQIELPDEATFRVEFAEPKVKRTTQEVVADRTFRLAAGLISPAEILMEERPGLDKATAEDIVQANLQFTRDLLDLNVIRSALQSPAGPAQAGF